MSQSRVSGAEPGTSIPAPTARCSEKTTIAVVSVLIATSGRVSSLRETLLSLCAVRVPDDFDVEVLLIENGVRSGVEEVAASLPSSCLHIRYLFESVAGKSRALNLAISQARGDILVFTDDDVRFPKEWLVEMCLPVINGEGVVVVGGSRLAPHILRNWMTRHHRSLLASTEYLLDSNPSEFAGINMACLREVFSKVPQFDCELGGGGLGNGEDTLFAYQLKQAGYSFVSRTTLHVEHHPAESRLSYRAWIRATRCYGSSVAYMMHHWYHEHIRFVQIKLLYYRLKLLLRLFINPRRPPDAEGIPPWEFSYRIDIATFKQFLHERRRPRNYAKRGLQKLDTFPSEPQ